VKLFLHLGKEDGIMSRIIETTSTEKLVGTGKFRRIGSGWII
jgi:hypothetical protein